MRNKIVSIVGTVGLPAKYGGWETLVSNLTSELNNDFDLTVFCSGVKYEEKPLECNGAKLRYVNLNANGVQSIPYDVISIYQSLKFADTVLILGVSGCVFLPFLRLFGKSKIIVNIDGLEWKRAKWNGFTKWFLKISEKVAVKWADVVVADNKAIKEYIADEHGVSSVLISYGANHVKKESLTDSVKVKHVFVNDKYAFKVCRIEPENNLDMILDAFKLNNSLALVIVGNWSNSIYGIELKRRYEQHSCLHLLDPIYNQKDLDMLRSNCSLYIHGHSAGGTNPSLVEAMSLQLPIVAFDVSYNRETTHNKAVYFSNQQELNGTLIKLDQLDLDHIAFTMSAIASEEYVWPIIAQKYAKIF